MLMRLGKKRKGEGRRAEPKGEIAVLEKEKGQRRRKKRRGLINYLSKKKGRKMK